MQTSTSLEDPMPRFPRALAIGLALAVTLSSPAAPAHAAWPAGVVAPSFSLGSHGLAEGYLLPGASPDEFYSLGYSVGLYGAWSMGRHTTNGVSTYTTYLGYDDLTFGESMYGFGFAPDGAGGFLHAYIHPTLSRYSLRSAHVSAAGTLFPGSGQTGYPIDTLVDAGSAAPAALTAPGGGAWYAWSRGPVRLTRVAVNGVRLAPWPARGWAIPKLPSPQWLATSPALASDGSNGLFVVSGDSCMRVQHVIADTLVDSAWPAAGLELGAGSALTGRFFFNARPTLVRSDAAHFFAIWNEYPATNLLCQRFATDGQLDPAWPAQGLLLQTSPANFDGSRLHCFADGSGGFTVAWLESTAVLARHVLATGSYAPGYESGPKLVATVVPYRSTPAPQAGIAGRPDGGLIVCWADQTGHVRGRWFDAAGAPFPSPALYEVDLGADTRRDSLGTQAVGAALPDGSDGAYLLLWASSVAAPYATSIAHVTQHGVAGVTPASPRIALAASPNPARDACTLRFTLADGGDANIALYDISGRRVRSYDVRGEGPHALTVDDVGALAPGVYLARLKHGGATRESRVVIVH
jgi:hypothetical protein